MISDWLISNIYYFIVVRVIRYLSGFSPAKFDIIGPGVNACLGFLHFIIQLQYISAAPDVIPGLKQDDLGSKGEESRRDLCESMTDSNQIYRILPGSDHYRMNLVFGCTMQIHPAVIKYQ